MSYNSLIAEATSFWKLQETSGNVVTDTKGTWNASHRNSTTPSTITSGTGPNTYLPNAILLNHATNQNIRIAGLHANNWPDAFTMVGWLKPPASFNSGSLNWWYSRFFAISGLGNVCGEAHDGHINVGGFSSGVTRAAVGAGAQTALTWAHLARAYNRTSQVAKGWKNGTLQSSVTLSAPVWTASTSDSNLASWNNGGNDNTAAGHHAGYIFFPKVLSDSEVAELYAGPEPINTVRPTISAERVTLPDLASLDPTQLATLSLLDLEDIPLTGGPITVTRLVIVPGTWDAQNNGAISYAYQWFRNGTAVSNGYAGASNVYKITGADAGASIVARETASNSGGSDAPAYTLPYPRTYRDLDSILLAELEILSPSDLDYLAISAPAFAANPSTALIGAGEGQNISPVLAAANPSTALELTAILYAELALAANPQNTILLDVEGMATTVARAYPATAIMMEATGGVVSSKIFAAYPAITITPEVAGGAFTPIPAATNPSTTITLEATGGAATPVYLSAFPTNALSLACEFSLAFFVSSAETVSLKTYAIGGLEGRPIDMTGNGVTLPESGWGVAL